MDQPEHSLAPGITDFNVEMRMKNETAGVIAPAADLGSTVDPVLEQLAETLGAELLQYRPPSPQASGGPIEEEKRRGDGGEWEWVFFEDPDGLVATLDFPVYPTRVNWLVHTDEQPIQRPLSEAADMLDVAALLDRSPRSVMRSCVLALLNTQQWNLQNMRLPAWLEEELSRPDAHQTSGRAAASNSVRIGLSERSIAVSPQKVKQRFLEPLEPTARTWAEDVIGTLGDAYPNEIPRWLRQPPSAPIWLMTKIALHVHILLDDGSSWILPSLRRSSRNNRHLSDRRVAFRRWLAEVARSPVAVLLIDPQMFGAGTYPNFGAQLQTPTCEVATIMAPNVKISWGQCERHRETVGLISTSVHLT